RTGRLLAGPGGPGLAQARHRIGTPAAQVAAPVAPGAAPDGARLGAHLGGPALPRAWAVAPGATPCGLSVPQLCGADGGPAPAIATGPGHRTPDRKRCAVERTDRSAIAPGGACRPFPVTRPPGHPPPGGRHQGIRWHNPTD